MPNLTIYPNPFIVKHPNPFIVMHHLHNVPTVMATDNQNVWQKISPGKDQKSLMTHGQSNQKKTCAMVAKFHEDGEEVCV